MIVFLTTADTEILALSHAARDLPAGFPPVRAANPAALQAPGGPGRVPRYRRRGARGRGPPAGRPPRLRAGLRRAAGALPGGGRAADRLPGRPAAGPRPRRGLHRARRDRPDACSATCCTAASRTCASLLRYLADRLIGQPRTYDPPRELPWEGLYHPGPAGRRRASTPTWRPTCARSVPTLGLLFYRAHWMSGNLAFVDALIRAAEALSVNVLPVFCYSLKDDTAEAAGAPRVFRRFLLDEDGRPRVDVLINTLSFSVGKSRCRGRAWRPAGPSTSSTARRAGAAGGARDHRRERSGRPRPAG